MPQPLSARQTSVSGQRSPTHSLPLPPLLCDKVNLTNEMVDADVLLLRPE